MSPNRLFGTWIELKNKKRKSIPWSNHIYFSSMEHSEFDLVFVARCHFYIVDKMFGKLVEVMEFRSMVYIGWNSIGRCKILFSKINSYGEETLAFSHWMNEDMQLKTSRIAGQFQVKYLATDEEGHLRQTVGVYFATDSDLRAFTENFNEGVNMERKIRRWSIA